jgi:hypothetical protein
MASGLRFGHCVRERSSERSSRRAHSSSSTNKGGSATRSRSRGGNRIEDGMRLIVEARCVRLLREMAEPQRRAHTVLTRKRAMPSSSANPSGIQRVASIMCERIEKPPVFRALER